MDFALTEAQRELAALTRKILSGPADHLWSDLASAGVLAAALPEEVGGDGFGVLEQCAVLVELGRAVAPVPYLPTIVAASALARFGTPAQKAKWLVARQPVLTIAFEGEVVAEEIEDGWQLTGEKITVPYGTTAQLFLVTAGADVFLVEPGEVTITPQELVHGDAAQLEFSAVRAERLGAVTDWVATRYTVGLCAFQLGVTERALELTSEYARTRVQFDRPIGSFQAVAQRLADAFIDVTAIRLTLWQAASLVAQDLPADAEVATAKFWAADAGHRVAHTAVHVHGGTGIDMSHDLHRYFTAAKRAEFELGGATAQLLKLGEVL
ncbi:acyl-CoA dehydrogenase [Lentzea sp. NBRC 105346]|uniref:acyl-CoA dehydrogenase family protein n=1 Tax=Lentzea sp. NBRC 105346 TaxID=3032205 RepID=UPI0024A12999|nr:acyl-CoA dehydrogenase family protein [Lentzea sp. NBRC 105346]GLZ31790.1 acyl-CoA dehydrogenase [Lentzea sp. NBRC 105346]